MRFEWDNEKRSINLIKHGVDFYEAMSVFADNNAIIEHDIEHSTFEEDRFVLLGFSKVLNLLVVCYCIRDVDTIRIISARKANKDEMKRYAKGGN